MKNNNWSKQAFLLFIGFILVMPIAFNSCLKHDPYKYLNGYWAITELNINGEDSLATFKANAGTFCQEYGFRTPANADYGNSDWGYSGYFYKNCKVTHFGGGSFNINNNKINQGWIFIYPYDMTDLFLASIDLLEKKKMIWGGTYKGKSYHAVFTKTRDL